ARCGLPCCGSARRCLARCCSTRCCLAGRCLAGRCLADRCLADRCLAGRCLACCCLACCCFACCCFARSSRWTASRHGSRSWLSVEWVAIHTAFPTIRVIGRIGWVTVATAPTELADPTARLAARHLLHWRTGISDHETIADIECHNVKVALIVA